MPLKKILVRPGVSRENTRYLSETVGPTGINGSYAAGWYSGDKIRFRSGSPEKLGGWVRISDATYLGICRSLGAWVANDGFRLLGVGTNIKFYVENSNSYYDITPVTSTDSLPANSFTTTFGSDLVVVTQGGTTPSEGSFVTFTNPGTVNGIDLNGEFEIVSVGIGVFTVRGATVATGSGSGGLACLAAFQLSVEPAASGTVSGWGSGPWGSGSWGLSEGTLQLSLKLWSQANFGQDLVFARNGSEIFYWAYTSGFTSRAIPLSESIYAASPPTQVGVVLVSDVSRFVIALGATEYGTGNYNPLLVRWSEQEDPFNWVPSPTGQSGEIPLSKGSRLVAYVQGRQEILVWSDTSLYSLQYVGAPIVWSAQLLGDNISIANQNAAAYANGTAYWMGAEKFYKYDGTVQTLRCDLRQYVFSDINFDQASQICAGTNEGFNEVWWCYCSSGSTVVDRYVIYNYTEDIWYYGTIGRTAWLDSGLRQGPIAATYVNNIVEHEIGTDDVSTGVAVPIEAYIESAEFDMDDGHNFVFVWRVLPDLTFRNSLVENPQVIMTLYPMKNSGSGYTNPASVGGTNQADIRQGVELPVETFTGQVFTRIRGRQMAIRFDSTDLGVAWQLGAPRIDMRTDGRR